MAETPAGYIIPMSYQFMRLIKNMHGHSPTEGGMILFNDLQWANRINAYLREVNKTIDARYEGQSTVGTDHVPYIAVPSAPTKGWNQHYHTSPFDGGMIIGAGIHDHRDMSEGGYAYAVYHPGSSLPKMAYEREEVYS